MIDKVAHSIEQTSFHYICIWHATDQRPIIKSSFTEII